MRGIEGQSALARFMGETPQTLKNWESRGVSKQGMIKVEDLLGCSARWLRTGQDIDAKRVSSGLRPIANKSAVDESIDYAAADRGTQSVGKVPLITSIQAGMFAQLKHIDHGAVTEWVPTTQPITEHMFALRVVGDSMLNPSGFPSLPPGAIVIVDPSKPATSGSIVVACPDGSTESTIKQLIIDAGQRYLKPLNPHYPIKPITDDCVIIGTAVKVEFDL